MPKPPYRHLPALLSFLCDSEDGSAFAGFNCLRFKESACRNQHTNQCGKNARPTCS